MKRITLRVPDHQHAALCRALASVRLQFGNRYSLNDLCARYLAAQLSHGDATVPRSGAPAPLGDGTVHIPTSHLRTIQMPPPPPVPRPQPSLMETWTLRDVVEEPQPERSARASSSGGLPLTGGHSEAATVQEIDPVPAQEERGTEEGFASGEATGPDPNEQAEQDALAGIADAEAEAEARGQWESEGGPDGTD